MSHAAHSWKSFFAAASGKTTAQYRMMLEYAPSLQDALADDLNVFRLATELEDAGLITMDQRRPVLLIDDAKVAAAILISMVTTKVHCNSENFTTFLEVLKKDKATYGHILAKMKGKGVFYTSAKHHEYAMP